MVVSFRTNISGAPTGPTPLAIDYTPRIGQPIRIEATSDLPGPRGYYFVWRVDDEPPQERGPKAATDILDIPEGFDGGDHTVIVEVYAIGRPGPPDMGVINFTSPIAPQLLARITSPATNSRLPLITEPTATRPPAPDNYYHESITFSVIVKNAAAGALAIEWRISRNNAAFQPFRGTSFNGRRSFSIGGVDHPVSGITWPNARNDLRASLPAGQYRIQARVTDSRGQRDVAEINLYIVEVPSEAQIRITSPKNGEVFPIETEATGVTRLRPGPEAQEIRYHPPITFSLSVTKAATPQLIEWYISRDNAAFVPWSDHRNKPTFAIGGEDHPIQDVAPRRRDPEASIPEGVYRIAAQVRDFRRQTHRAMVTIYVGTRGKVVKDISEAPQLQPYYAPLGGVQPRFDLTARGEGGAEHFPGPRGPGFLRRLPRYIARRQPVYTLGGKSKLVGGFERESLAYRSMLKWGQEHPRIRMAINRGKRELNNQARQIADSLYRDYAEELRIVQQEYTNARNGYFEIKRRLAREVRRTIGFFRYTIRRGTKLPLGLGGAQELLEDQLERMNRAADRDELRRRYERFSRTEGQMNKMFTEKIEELEKNIRERLEKVAPQIAKKYIYRYKIPREFLEPNIVDSELMTEAADIATVYARNGRARLKGMWGLMTRVSMKSHTLRDVWYTMLYNIWDFIWGPMFLGLIMSIFVMGGFISLYILPTYNLNPSMFLYIIPLLGAGLNMVMNFGSNKYALDWMDSMISGALIAQGITVFLFALIGPPGVWLNSLPYYLLFTFLFIFFGVFQFYQVGGFPIVVKMAVFVLIFGWVALGPYKAVYEGAINQIRTPVLVAWRAGSTAVYDIWLLATNPTQWYARQQTINVKPEKPLAVPRALEVASIDVLPQNVPQGQEFAMVMVIKNEGDLEARNIKLRDENGNPKVGCNAYCDSSRGVINPNSLAFLKPGEAERINIERLKAITDQGREYEFRLGKVSINISYEYATNSSLLVTVMTSAEFKRRFAEKEDVYRQVVAVWKPSPAKLSLNVGPQPLEASDESKGEAGKKKALLLVAISNDRDDGKIFLRKNNDYIILRMQKAIGKDLSCGGTQFKDENAARIFGLGFDKTREELLVYVVPNDQEIRQFEFKTVFALLCSFETADLKLLGKEVQTGLITAELPKYEFRIIKETDIPITAAVGILASDYEDTCSKCGTRGGGILGTGVIGQAADVCTRDECRKLSPSADKQCWFDSSASLLGLGYNQCRACKPNTKCPSFRTPEDCKGESKVCGLNCRWVPSDRYVPYVPFITITDQRGRCVEAPPPTFMGSVNYCRDNIKAGGRACWEGEGECNNNEECDKTVVRGAYTGTVCTFVSEFGYNLCCIKPKDPKNEAEKNKLYQDCIDAHRIKLEQEKALLASGNIPQRIIAVARQMKSRAPADADEQIKREGIVDPSSKEPFVELVLKLAKQETGFRQCADGTLNCVTDNSYSTVYCSTCKAVEGSCSFVGERLSCGVMQINIKAHSPGNQRFGCSAGSFADLDCNVRAGIQILLDSYNSYKNGQPNPCGYNYVGWKAAIRGYNGWGCGANADTKFVENVIARKVGNII